MHVRLGDDEAVFLVSRQVTDLLGDVWLDVDPFRRQLADLVSQLVIDLGARRCDHLAVFAFEIRAHVLADQLIGLVLDLAQHAAIRRLDEAVFVDASVRGQ